MRVYLENLGCPKNQVDGERILGILEASGLTVVDDPQEADAILVNTCGFIEAAREESIETILELAQLKNRESKKRLFVIGCLAQRWARELRESLPEVDGVFGMRNPEEAARALIRTLGARPSRCDFSVRRHLLNARHYAYLKIAEGCDNRCAYCLIPVIKGRYRSRDPEEIVAEAEALAWNGVRELNIVAQDTTFYGRDRGETEGLARLLDRLSEIEPIRWIRLLYAHPAHLSDGVIRHLAENPKVCRYLDLPIQHASDRILSRMGRQVTQMDLRRIVERLRSDVPGIVLRTTVLVGFPGETGEDFEELLRFLTWARFERIGVFGYSREEGTRAARMPDQVDPDTVVERVNTVSDLAESLASDWYEQQVGRILEVLVDGLDPDDGLWLGRTQWDAPEIDGVVRIPGAARAGEFLVCEITDAAPFQLEAVPLEVTPEKALSRPEVVPMRQEGTSPGR